MKPTILILNGAARSGKDTFIETMYDLTERLYNYSFVEDIKNLAEMYFGYTGGKTPKDRQFLSKLCDLTNEYCNFCHKSLLEFERQVKYMEGFNQDYIIIFVVRRPSDIEKLKEHFHNMYKVITLCIRNEEKEAVIKDNAGLYESSDVDVLDYNYNVYIYNNNTIEEYKDNIKLWWENK